MNLVDSSRLCRKCGEPKSLDRFYKGSKSCNDCIAAQVRFRRANKHLPTFLEQLKSRSEKTCKNCGETKGISEFPKNRLRCIACETARKKAWADSNREAVRAAGLRWCRNNKEWASRYYESNRERHKQSRKEYAERWRIINWDRCLVTARNRRARLRKAEGSHSSSDIKDLYARQGSRCAEPSCRKSLGGKFHVDHIMPLILGGSNDPGNLQLLCQHCNMRKGKMHPVRWANLNGRLF